MSNKYIPFFILLCLFISTSTFADCSREDIQFYLDKGFTQEQVTQLCSTSNNGNDSPDYTPYQQQVIIYKEGGEAPGLKDGLTKEEREAVSVINAGGNISKLQVTPQNISYSAKVCIISANSPEVDQRYKDCIDVDFVVQRKDLIVSSSGKKLLLFGNQYVLLEGIIDAKPKRAWEDYPIDVRRALKRNFEWQETGKKTKFPVDGDYSVTRLVNAFRTLAETYGENEETNQVAATQDDDETKEVVAEPKEDKKKKWWNPFD